MIKKEKKIIERKLVSYLNDKVFTGCALSFSCLKEDTIDNKLFFVGTTGEKKGVMKVEEGSYFDLASLTKPLVTVLSLLALIKDGKIKFEQKLSELLPGSIPDDKKNIKLIELISHYSGLPSHRPYYKKLLKLKSEERKKILIKYILNEKLEKAPGRGYIYSDLDYILLGYIIEEKSEERLDVYWKRKISDPLNLSNYFKFTNEYLKDNHKNYVVTGYCPWSKKTLSGVVHDDNCRALGQLSGHAGLFSTIKGVSSLAEYLLLIHDKKKSHPSFKTEDLLFLLKKRKSTNKICGFDTPAPENSASGKCFSKNSIGHLGFTGTSFWIDLSRKKLIVLLTNRVFFGEDNFKIRKIRPDIHDVVMSTL